MPFSDPQRHLHDVLEAAIERKIQILTEAIIRLDRAASSTICSSVPIGPPLNRSITVAALW